MSEWSREAVEILIESYRRHEVLYNSKLPAYQNKHQRHTALGDVADSVQRARLNTTPEDVRKKMISLRTHYGQELQKMRGNKKSGSGTVCVYVPSVWWFPLMHFLQDHMQSRKSENSLPSTWTGTYAVPATDTQATNCHIPAPIEVSVLENIFYCHTTNCTILIYQLYGKSF